MSVMRPGGNGAKKSIVEMLRLQIAPLERRGVQKSRHASLGLRFGIDPIDQVLGDVGLPCGAVHEVLGGGADSEHAALPSLLVASLLVTSLLASPDDSPRQVLWAMRGRDLFAPALSAAGLHPDRLILVEAGRAVLEVMEEALRHPGLLAVVGEVDGRFGLTASRRLQLAAEASGVVGFALRRGRSDDPLLTAPSAASSRWRVVSLPPPRRHVAALARPEDMLGPALWRLELLRCRSTLAVSLPLSWTVERCDETGRLSLAAALADRPADSQQAG